MNQESEERGPPVEPVGATSPDAASGVDESIPVAELVEPDAERPAFERGSVDAAAGGVERVRPRVWTALTVGVATMPLAGLLSGLLLLACLRAEQGGRLSMQPAELKASIDRFAQTRLGLIVMIAPGQLMFLATALAAARLSPVGWRARLNLDRGRWPVWTWFVLAAGTPMIGFLSSALVGALVDAPSENLKMLETVFRTQQGPFVLLLYFLVGVLPGLGEELLFRGYVQSRLAQAWPAWLAVILTSAMFAVAHFDPVHVLAVFPLGVWLGLVARRTGSIGPAVLGHVVNNCLAVGMARAGRFDVDDPTAVAWRGGVVMGCGVALAAAVALLLTARETTRESTRETVGHV